MWIYVDSDRVAARQPNNMSGNTGWVEYDGEIVGPLTDEYGVLKYAYDNGAIRERTEEERAADRPAPPPQRPTLEEIYAALEMLLNGVTDDE